MAAETAETDVKNEVPNLFSLVMIAKKMKRERENERERVKEC